MSGSAMGSRDAYLRAMGLVRWVPRCLDAGDAHEAAAGHGPHSADRPEAGTVTQMDWAALRASVAGCRRCDLHASRTHSVFGVGDTQADWMIIGEAPGAEEDRQGEPFVGRAGKLLNAMLAAVGLTREAVFIANILKCRPPDNRDPTAAEAARCAPYLQRQIELVSPRLILAVGRVAAQHLLVSDSPIGRLRGRVHRHPTLEVPVVVTYHPAYLLRRPAEKAQAWEDLMLAWRVSRGETS